MLAPAVIVPLGLALVASSAAATNERLSLAYRAAVFLLPLDVLASGPGWMAPPGHPNAILCAREHVVVCGLIAFYGAGRALARFRDDGGANGASGGRLRGIFTPLPELAMDVGMMLLPVGSVWLLASRSASPLAGFQEPIVTLTAAHFHYAGFAAPVILGGVGRLFALAEAKTARAYAIGTLTVCAGIPLTAIGIMTTHAVEATAAIALACVPRRAAQRSKIAAVLFALSGIALLGTMGLAATFALTSSAGRTSTFSGPLSVQTMIDFHGGGNALGFALGALLALTLVDSSLGVGENRSHDRGDRL